jgi:NitT/TauT family transport system substrate-binding protein
MSVIRSSRASFLATGAALVATSRTALGQPAPAPRPHISLGTSAIDGAMGCVSAQRAGYFAKQGLDVDFVIGSGASNSAAVVGGSLQFAGSNVVTLIKAHLQGVPFQIVCPGAIYDTNDPTQVLCVRTDSGFKSGADLNGKTIAVTAIGDLLSTSTLAWIDQNGGQSSTVKLVEFPPSAQVAALETGRVQAAALAEPFLSQATGDGSVKIFAKIFDAIALRYLEAAYVGMPDYINANAETIRRFATAVLDGGALANQHPDQTLPWLVDFAHIDPAVAKRVRRERFATTVDPSLVQVEIDALARLKLIDRSFDARDLFSPVVLKMRR